MIIEKFLFIQSSMAWKCLIESWFFTLLPFTTARISVVERKWYLKKEKIEPDFSLLTIRWPFNWPWHEWKVDINVSMLETKILYLSEMILFVLREGSAVLVM